MDFPLDLDIAHAIMAGIVIANQGDPRKALPAGSVVVTPGTRFRELENPLEYETAPSALKLVSKLIADELDVETFLLRLTLEPTLPDGRAVSQREACAALAAAKELGWLAFRA